MPLISDALTDAIQAVLEVFDQEAVISYTEKGYTPTTGFESEDVWTVTVACGPFTPAKKTQRDSGASMHRYQTIVAAKDFDGASISAPAVGHTITYAGASYKITQVEPIPGLDPVAYQITVEV